MAVKLGLTDIADVKLGTTQVDKICLGSTEVWSKTPAPAIKALKFTSAGAQTLSVDTTKMGTLTPSFEYSLDQGATWASWNPTADGVTPISFGSGTDLYLRGMNQYLAETESGIKWVQFVFSTSSSVSCTGNIMHLLDYTQDLTEIPQVSEGRGFYSLFSDCTVLTTPPALPATALRQSECYGYMFKGCTNLLSAPELPATTISRGCYQYMFSGCSSLTTPPALIPTGSIAYMYRGMFLNCTSLSALPYLNVSSAPNSGLTNMFNGCSLIKMSETQTDEYQNELTFAFTPSNWSASNMFANTGGTFTGTPTQATYYTSNPIIGGPTS